MNTSPLLRHGELWAITAYFNPIGYRRRLANYRAFRAHFKQPLIAVELAYGTDFDLDQRDAEILIQLRGHDVMWQKERLLNVALRALPSHCRKVAWVDCDVIFGDSDWANRASRLLDDCPIVQSYGLAHHLPRDWLEGDRELSTPEFSRRAVVSAIRSGEPAEVCITQSGIERREERFAKGLCWAARREFLDAHGFYDVNVVGGGNAAEICAYYGHFDALMRHHCMNDRQRARYLAWARPVHADVRGAVGCLDLSVFHLWHGEMRNRQIMQRHRGFSRFQFDPFRDIAIDANGCWRWNTDKPEMHAYVRDYFVSRREDG